MKTYNELISKIDTFIKKYYKVRIARGLILSSIILLSFYLLFSVSEFYLKFSVTGRTIVFFSYITIFLSVLFFFIIRPVLKLLNFGRRINYKQASSIISDYFPEIKDKLLNILELEELQKEKPQFKDIIFASINQKAVSIKIIPFRNAVKYKENRKYLKYLIPILLIFGALLSFSPSLFKESNKRIVNYKKEFIEPLPFTFNLLTKNLKVKRGQDIELKLNVSGKYIPDEIFINYSGNNFLMKKEPGSKTNFTYTFKNLNNSFRFFFSSQEIKSKNYQVQVLPYPAVLKFVIYVDIPSYTGENDTIYNNIGDIVVPYGSNLKWQFKTAHVDSLWVISGKSKLKAIKKENIYTYSQRLYKNFNYKVSVLNKNFQEANLINFNISVIPDLYPSIITDEIKDTANIYLSYFRGVINDDYGFKSLTFKYRVVEKSIKENDNSFKFDSNNLPFQTAQLKQEFFYEFDFGSNISDEGKKVQYYFEVGDNDGISGSKRTRTQIMTFNIPTYKEKKEHNNLANQNIQSKLEQSVKLAEDIKKDLELIRERNLSGNISDWENKQMLNSILEKQKKLDNLTKELAKENLEKNKPIKLNKQNEELIKKQEEIQKLLDEIMTDELKELMKELEKLQDKFNQELMNKLLEKYEFSYEEMSDRLERTKELLQREQIEQKIDNVINELEKLSEKQQQLSEKTQNKKEEKEELLQEQKNIEERFDETKKEYEEAKKINEELKRKMNLEEFSEEKKNIKEEFEQSKENLEKNKNKKASQSQQKNSQNIKKMAQSMNSMMQKNNMKQQSEDLDALRRLLENLLTFSFKQESLTDNFKTIHSTNPKYIEFSDKQRLMKEDFKIINDSLKSLSNRISQISKTILDELYIINDNLNKVNAKLDDKYIADSRIMQGKIMTSVNNLALLLSAIMDQMKNQMSGSGEGTQDNKRKNKGKNKSFQDLKQQQESLKQQMENMLKQMKDGKGSFSKNMQNKALAKMLAQQEIFKQMLKEMQSKHSLNPETQKLLNEINKMSEENEKDIVNRIIDSEFIERQKLIETRLLEAEKAENKRKTENKREAKEGDEKIYKSAKDVFNKSKKQNTFKEDLYRKNIQLRNYYKKLYEEYSKTISDH